MKVDTVRDSSVPCSIIRKQRGMISVERRNLITSFSSVFTMAPITPSDVRRRYSNGREDLVVCRKGYRKSGILAKTISSSRYKKD